MPKFESLLSKEALQLIKRESERDFLVKYFDPPKTRPTFIEDIATMITFTVKDPKTGLLGNKKEDQIVLVSKEQTERALRILHILYLEFAKRKFYFEFTKDKIIDRARCPRVKILDTFVRFQIREELEWEPLPNIVTNSNFDFYLQTNPRVILDSIKLRPSGKLSLSIQSPNSLKYRSVWRETERMPLQSLLNSFIKGLIIHADGYRTYKSIQNSLQLDADSNLIQ